MHIRCAHDIGNTACATCAADTAGSTFVAAGKKSKRVVVTVEDKLRICTLVKSGMSTVLYQIAQFFLCNYC